MSTWYCWLKQRLASPDTNRIEKCLLIDEVSAFQGLRNNYNEKNINFRFYAECLYNMRSAFRK